MNAGNCAMRGFAVVLGVLLLAPGGSGVRAADGVPAIPQPGLEFVMAVAADIEPAIDMGKTPAGTRRVIPVSGGSFEGPKIKGAIMPGGEDWQVTRPDGVTEFEARYWLKTSDGVIIKVRNRAIAALTPEDQAKAAKGERVDINKVYLRTSPEFEAPLGAYEWLNKAIFVGTLVSEGPKRVVIRYYKVT